GLDVELLELLAVDGVDQPLARGDALLEAGALELARLIGRRRVRGLGEGGLDLRELGPLVNALLLESDQLALGLERLAALQADDALARLAAEKWLLTSRAILSIALLEPFQLTEK